MYDGCCQSCVKRERRERKSGGRVGLMRGVCVGLVGESEREIKEMEEEEEED